MRSIVLVPYCPWPSNTGACVEMMKHLDVLRSLGDCSILSSSSFPVGRGWNASAQTEILNLGYTVALREAKYPSRSCLQWVGIIYAAVCKSLRLDRAFGHSNPYHRHAFPVPWWLESSRQADIALINYSYWAWLPTYCPKVVILHDLLSKTMWEGAGRETKELSGADLIVVISKDEEEELYRRGVKNVLWSPPLVVPSDFPLTPRVGLVGSLNRFNQEGLKWLELASIPDGLTLTLYGALSSLSRWPDAYKVGAYANPHDPYSECGIILLPTAFGTGVQIKAVEALASGRAIIARHGAMRGLPAGEGAWIEVSSPDEMWLQAKLLSRDEGLRLEQGRKARAYYKRYLDHTMIRRQLKESYLSLLKPSHYVKKI